MFKKATSLILILLVSVVFVFSGCRKQKDPPRKNYAGVVLTYYKVFDDSDVIEPLINEFIQSHPGLEINYKKFSDFEEYKNTILNELADGDGPDIFSMQNTWFTSNTGKLSPMPESLVPEEKNVVGVFKDLFVNVAYDDLVLTDKEGIPRVYALPMTVDTLALYYNKSHFEDRIPTNGKPSTTWDGIKDDVVKLKKEDNSFERFEVAGIAMGRADNISRAVDVLYLLFLQHGVKFYNQNVSAVTFAGKDLSVSPAMQALKLLVSFSDPDQKNFTWNEFVVNDDSGAKEVEAFARGKVSMIIGYSYTYDDIVNEINVLSAKGVKTIDKSDIQIAPIPQLEDPDVSSEKRVTYASYFAETVSRNSEHSELAWEFLVFLTQKDSLEHYFDKLHKPTSRRDMIDEQRKHPIYGIFASQIGFAESFPIVDYYVYKDLFEEMINNASDNGVASIDLLKAQNTLNDMLPDEGYIVPLADGANE